MRKKSKRLAALLLSFLMVISMIPVNGLTVEAAAKHQKEQRLHINLQKKVLLPYLNKVKLKA